MEMTYEEAKAHAQKLEEKNRIDSDKLRVFEKDRNAMGTPDHIRALPEWKDAKKSFNLSFAELRKFNQWYVKTFKKELVIDRDKRRLSRNSKA